MKYLPYSRVGKEKKVTFRNKKINFEIRNIFRKGSKKYRMFDKISKKKHHAQSCYFFISNLVLLKSDIKISVSCVSNTKMSINL